MSHFVVAVLEDGTKGVEDLLAPYQENNMDDCPRQYLEFFDAGKFYRNKYEQEGTTKVKFPDGHSVFPWDIEELKKEIPFIVLNDADDKTKYQNERWFCTKYHYGIKLCTICFDLQAAGAVLTEVPFKESYPKYEEFLKQYMGFSFDEEQQAYGYWANPNAKWDWFEIGGRWNEILKTKSGQKVNFAAIKDLDFTPDDAVIEHYRNIWRVIVSKEKIDSIKHWQLCDFDDAETLIKTYGTEENFVKIKSQFSTFAVITPDGQWHEKGEMGCFAYSSETPDEAYEWAVNYKSRFIDAFPPETIITIVDCHI